MTISAELQEAAIYQAAKAYWLGCQAESANPPTEADLEMIHRLAAYKPTSSNAIRAAAIAVLEFMDLRSKDACIQCSAPRHSCGVCGERTDHWHEVTADIPCEACMKGLIRKLEPKWAKEAVSSTE